MKKKKKNNPNSNKPTTPPPTNDFAVTPKGGARLALQQQGTAAEHTTREEYPQTSQILALTTRYTFLALRSAVAHLVILNGLHSPDATELLVKLLTLLSSTVLFYVLRFCHV